MNAAAVLPAPVPRRAGAPAAPGRALAAWHALERGIDRWTGPALNPLHHLGSMAFLCFWTLAASGIYLYAVIDTSAAGAHASIERLAAWPWFYGGWLRSVHRYAADAFVLLMGLHALREWLHGRFRAHHRFSWLTGVPLIVFAFVCGIGGFWLNWDELGQYSALATAEWLDALPGLTTPLARNFLSLDTVGDRLFSLFVFVHLGVALLMTFGLWFHIQRLPRARVVPPQPLALGLLAMFVGLATVTPVVSGPAADMTRVPAALRLDWLLLFVHPMADALSGGLAWVVLGGALAGLLWLPFMPHRREDAPAARVDPDYCSGCRRCVDDCPYAAIGMVAHPSGKPGHELAVVDAERCARCGICAGACPSATPFRSVADLQSGIDMPQLPVNTLREQLRQRLQAAPAARSIVAFRCAHVPPPACLLAPDVVAIELLCVGQLPPAFVEYALRDGAAGVLVQACAPGHCAFRDGATLLHERLHGVREPRLRPTVPRERWAMVWSGARDADAIAPILDRWRGPQSARERTPSALELST
ncbi:MAG TPA: hydrogenase iron-sulfur subunit [Ottowia sp.]|nr:hydrogenase iron-sulfur subunit [Ottowia sp.]